MVNLSEQIQNELNFIENLIKKYENEISQKSYLILSEKKLIIEMNENNNNQVKDKIINYYDLSNENSENEENLSIYKINETELKALSYEISTISNEKNDEKCNKLNKRFEKIKK